MSKVIRIVLFYAMWNNLFSQRDSRDCLGAIQVCQVRESNVSGVNYGNLLGHGSVSEINTGDYCIEPEVNSTWYEFSPRRDGLVGFRVSSSMGLDNVDWAVWDLSKHSCKDILDGTAPMVSCNSSSGDICLNNGGATGETDSIVQGPECKSVLSNYNALIPVTAGGTYVLMVDNRTSGWGNSVDFRLTDPEVGIYDETPPYITGFSSPENCGKGEITITVSEPIIPESITNDNFLLIGPNGTVPVTLQDASFTNSNFEISVGIDSIIDSIGSYTFTIIPTLSDYRILQDFCGNELESDTLRFEIFPSDGPADILPDSAAFCKGTALELSANIEGESYQWSDGSVGNSLNVNEFGDYSVTVTGSCGDLWDSVQVVELFPPDAIDLPSDTVLCHNNTILLNEGVPEPQMANFSWAGGWPSWEHPVHSPGTYTIKLTNDCGEYLSSLSVDYKFPIEHSVVLDTCIEDHEKISADVSQATPARYLWEDGDTMPVKAINQVGTYRFSITNDCGVSIDSFIVKPCNPCKIYFPNAITPNGDGINDEFGGYSSCGFLEYNMRIYDRWGNLLFESSDPDHLWDGRNSGKLSSPGAYIYDIFYRLDENRTHDHSTGILYVII